MSKVEVVLLIFLVLLSLAALQNGDTVITSNDLALAAHRGEVTPEKGPNIWFSLMKRAPAGSAFQHADRTSLTNP